METGFLPKGDTSVATDFDWTDWRNDEEGKVKDGESVVLRCFPGDLPWFEKRVNGTHERPHRQTWELLQWPGLTAECCCKWLLGNNSSDMCALVHLEWPHMRSLRDPLSVTLNSTIAGESCFLSCLCRVLSSGIARSTGKDKKKKLILKHVFKVFSSQDVKDCSKICITVFLNSVLSTEWNVLWSAFTSISFWLVMKCSHDAHWKRMKISREMQLWKVGRAWNSCAWRWLHLADIEDTRANSLIIHGQWCNRQERRKLSKWYYTIPSLIIYAAFFVVIKNYAAGKKALISTTINNFLPKSRKMWQWSSPQKNVWSMNKHPEVKRYRVSCHNRSEEVLLGFLGRRREMASS